MKYLCIIRDPNGAYWFAGMDADNQSHVAQLMTSVPDELIIAMPHTIDLMQNLREAIEWLETPTHDPN